MNPFIFPLVIVLTKTLTTVGKVAKNYLNNRTANYCKGALIDDCNLAKEFDKFLAPIIGGAVGISAGVFFISLSAPGIPPLVKAIETIVVTTALGALGAISAYGFDSDSE